jgi:sarcosine/dimethylglycine N-methyltransferase
MTDVERDEARLHYGLNGIDRLYARVWGDSIHFGYYPTPDLDLEAATYEAKSKIAEFAELRAGASVLEVASGWGTTARYLARAHAVHVTATNIEAAHLSHARNLSEQSGMDTRVSHQFADFHDLPYAADTFDVWWCQEATVHAQDKARLFNEAARVLKPGGLIVFTDQTTRRQDCSDADLARLSARHGSDDLFDSDQFLSAMEEAGFHGAVFMDWSEHMAQHFAKLVARIEVTYAALTEEIGFAVVDDNLDLWRFGRDLAWSGGIGWGCFAARKS